MSAKIHDARAHQLASLERRLRELDELASMAAHGIIVGSMNERRTLRAAFLEREMNRLRAELKRLEREPELAKIALSEAEADHHLAAIERQLREVGTERESWFRSSLEGQRRRREDFRLLQRLKE